MGSVLWDFILSIFLNLKPEEIPLNSCKMWYDVLRFFLKFCFYFFVDEDTCFTCSLTFFMTEGSITAEPVCRKMSSM